MKNLFPHWRRRRRLIAGLLALAVVAGGGWAFQRSRAVAPPASAKAAQPTSLVFSSTEVISPRRQAMPMAIEFSGPLVAPRTAIVRAKASGTLLSLAVGEGSRVQAGQVLGRIDLSDLESRVVDRSAAVESAQVALKDAERQHEANLRLSNENFISSTALQSSQARLDGARAALKSAEAQLSTSRIGVRDAALVAPIDGIVGKRHVVPGERVSAEQMVVTLVDLSTLELLGAVGTHEVSLLQVGMPVDLTIENQPQSTTKQRNARIDRIAPSAEPGTRAIGVVVALENPAERLRAGQYGQARVTIDDREQRLTVPIAAVTQTSGQDQVWTIENGALVRRIVITGRRDVAGGRVEVLRGLPDDARLLAVRFDNLKEGVLASVANKPREAASVAASNAPRS